MTYENEQGQQLPGTYRDSRERTPDSARDNNERHRTIPKRRGSKYADILLRRLQTTVLHDADSAVIGMLSFARRQGVTTQAVNLAIRAADHGHTPSLVIDANFHNQKVTRMYRCTGQGLGECINGQAAIDNCVKKTNIPGFNTLGAGRNKLSKQILLDPEYSTEFFKVVRNDFKFTVVDLPATREPSVVESIVPQLDGVLLVARYGARKEQLAAMQAKVRNAGGQVYGIVMTGNEQKLPGWLPKFLS